MRRRLMIPALLSITLATTSCAGTYEHVAGGALAGGVAGGMAGVVCCHHPADAGPGILIGAAVGALIGLVIDWVDPV